MTFFRVCTFTASVVQQLSVGPTVVSDNGVVWSCTVVSVEIGEGGSEFGDFLQGLDKLKLARSERCCEGAVGGCHRGYCGTVVGSGGD